jgi:hypothetical protein
MMATWNTITVTGGQDWLLAGGGITNHEVFAFTLQSSENNVGAQISNVTVFDSNDDYPNQTSYYVTVQAVQWDPATWALTPVNQGITGNFESNGV